MESCAACDRPVYARGHCERHYRQLLRRGRLSPDRLPAPCAAQDCDRVAVTRGWCHAHYLRWVRAGDAQEAVPLRDRAPRGCEVDGCDQAHHGRGLCRTHLARLDRLGHPDADRPVRRPSAGGWTSHGYRGVPVPLELRHLTGGAAAAAEHRLVMAVLLDRPLARDEVVHHRNGDRQDNRPANLELWSTAQPKGQRVQDKLDWALALLERYEPDAAEAARRALP